MQNQQIFCISNATFQELRIIVQQWQNNESWNPGIQDANAFWAADSQGFFVGKLQGKMIGCVSAVKYTQTKTGFVGLYIVLPEYRGKGYGLKIFNKGLQYLKGYNIGLDGVIAQQQNYKKSGFKHFFNHMRYQILGQNKPLNYIRNQNIKDFKKGQVSFEKISLYDRQMFPSKRDEFLQQFFKQTDAMIIAFCENNEYIKGYGVVRKSAQGYKVGPLFADSSLITLQIIKQFRYFISQEQKMYIDVPDANNEAVNLIQSICSLSRMFECARMYTNYEPKLNMKKIYGQTTLELG